MLLDSNEYRRIPNSFRFKTEHALVDCSIYVKWRRELHFSRILSIILGLRKKKSMVELQLGQATLGSRKMFKKKYTHLLQDKHNNNNI